MELADCVETVAQKMELGFTPAEAVIPYVAPKGIMEGQLSFYDL